MNAFKKLPVMPLFIAIVIGLIIVLVAPVRVLSNCRNTPYTSARVICTVCHALECPDVSGNLVWFYIPKLMTPRDNDPAIITYANRYDIARNAAIGVFVGSVSWLVLRRTVLKPTSGKHDRTK